MEKSGKHQRHQIPQDERKRRAAKARAARRRKKRNRRILIICLAAAAVLLIAAAGIFIARRNRAKREAEEAAMARSADVTEAAFSDVAPGDAGVHLQSASTGETADNAAGYDTGAGSTAAQEAAEAGTDLTNDAQQVHVRGIERFSLYRFDEAAGQRVKTERFASAWTHGEDIISLEAFATDETQFALSAGGGGAWYDAFRAYWYRDADAGNCRIGYHVSFRLRSGEEINATLLKPGDELFYREYLENYLYDDAANADAGWYSHLEPGQETDETLLTSIKFTPGERVDEIDGTITVTAFVYDTQEDFGADGRYIGDVAFTTVLEKEN